MARRLVDTKTIDPKHQQAVATLVADLTTLRADAKRDVREKSYQRSTSGSAKTS